LSRTLRRSADSNYSSHFENLFLKTKTVPSSRGNIVLRPQSAVRFFSCCWFILSVLACQEGFIKIFNMISSETKTALAREGFLPNPSARLRNQFHEVARHAKAGLGREKPARWFLN
jgi:hypothetical protein